MKEFGNNNGIIYVDQPTDVLKKVIGLYNDNGSFEECRTKATKLVEKHSWDKITEKFESILSSLLRSMRAHSYGKDG